MNFNNIPDEMKAQRRWVGWKMEERDGQPTKVPVNPRTGGGAMVNKPSTWSDYQTAIAAIEKYQLQGIGFVLGDGWIGVDIDKCHDENGFTSEAIDIIDILDSYTEMSQSGKGVHIICRGVLPPGQRRRGNIEMYESKRFFVMTGNILDDAHMEVRERTEELRIVHEKYLQKQKSTGASTPIPKQDAIPLDFSDDELINKIMESKQRDLFISLMNGDISGYSSLSEADLALCNILAFWTQKDEVRIDRIYRRSGLYRQKWDRITSGSKTYGQMTIEKAVAGCQTVYNPPAPGKKKQKRPPDELPPIEIYEQLIPESTAEGTPSAESNGELPPWIWGPYNDTWNACRLVERHGENLRYNPSKGWLIWNGVCWEEDRAGRVRLLVDDTILSLRGYIDVLAKHSGKAAEKLRAWLSTSRNTGRKDNMLKEASYFEGISTLPEQFDRDVYLLNCQNGTIDLRTGKLLEHSRNNLITKVIPVEYHPDAKAPIWEKFLNRIFDGNTELIRFIQRAVGYSLTGSIKEQCIFILHGVGKNGKSTFLNTIRTMMGSYTRNANAQVFMKSGDTLNYPEIARLQGARFVTTTEPEENEKLSESLIKQVTGGEPVTAKELYKSPFEFTPEFKLWMATNHKPKISGTDLGIWRRIRLIPFNVIIPDNEIDRELGHKLQNELPGILNWALAGCAAWMKDGLKEPAEVLSATESYQSEMDTLFTFISECIVEKKGEILKAGDLYKVYEAWCSRNGEYKISATKFSLKLKERGFKQGKSKVMRYWEDIQLTKFGRSLQFGPGYSDHEQEQIPDIPW